MRNLNNYILIFLIFTFYSSGAQDGKYSKYQSMANKWNSEQFVIIKRKAAFETGCDTSKMKLSVLETRFDANGGDQAYGGLKLSKKQKEVDEITATSVGVDGCGEKSTYILMPTGGWMLNSTNKSQKNK